MDEHKELTEGKRFFRDVRRARRRAMSPRPALELQMPPPPPALYAAASTHPDPAMDRYLLHPGSGVTPQLVVAYYQHAEAGWPMEQCDLFDDVIERDGHLRSVLSSRALAVAGKKWQVMAGGDSADDVRAAELLQAALKETNWPDAMMHMLSSRPYGWAATEIDWVERDGDVVPKWFVNVPHRRFRFDEFDRPRLTTTEDLDGQPLRPGGWLFGRNTISVVTARSGLMRTAAWFSLFKTWSWRDWVIYAEKFGIPLVLGKWDAANASEEDKSELAEVVRNIGEDGQATMSSEANVEIHEVQQGGQSTNLHAAVVTEANKELSKLITGSTLTVETGGPGSFALGKVHDSRAFDLVLADAEFLMRRFRSDLARPFLAHNGFRNTATPELVVHVSRDSAPLTRATLAEKLWAMNVQLDIEQLREEFQFRAPPSSERALPGPVAPAAPASSGEVDE
jgi:phage gp29-like protein